MTFLVGVRNGFIPFSVVARNGVTLLCLVFAFQSRGSPHHAPRTSSRPASCWWGEETSGIWVVFHSRCWCHFV